MRKITKQLAEAFRNRQTKSLGNSRTDRGTLYLHGNAIARTELDSMTGLYISMAGWGSNTTKERLNGLLEVLGSRTKIYQKNFILYLSNSHKGWSIEMDPKAWYFLPFDGTEPVQVPCPAVKETF